LTTPTLIQSLQRGLKVIEAITDNGPLTAKSVSASTGIVLPTAYHLLRTLIHEGYLRRLADGRYTLGPQLLSVTQLEGKARRFRLVREVISVLAEETRSHVTIGVLKEEGVVVWTSVDNLGAPPINRGTGTTLPAHATAIGKSILVRMPSTTRGEYVRRHPLRALTSRTCTIADRVIRDLAPGDLARSEQELQYGVSCVAVELSGMGDLAAIGAAYPTTRSPQARAHIEGLLVKAADQISASMTKTNSLQVGGCAQAI
jgi:IclR family transcriptional regulator, acetate operon repressor